MDVNRNLVEIMQKVLVPLSVDVTEQNFRNNTVERLDVNLCFDPTIEYMDFGTVRPASRTYIKNELDWYLSLDKSIRGHKGIETNPIWKSCATDKEGYVNSNYGNIAYDKLHDNKSQFDYAIERLIKDKCTRQSVIIYTRPQLQYECEDNIHAKHDFTCTYNTQHFITNKNEFIYIVNMRSNDAIFGLQNDYSWHRYVYWQMFEALKKKYWDLKPGVIKWHAGSMHVYERHFQLLNDIVSEYTRVVEVAKNE